MTDKLLRDYIESSKKELISAMDRQSQTLACLKILELKLRYKLSTVQVLDQYAETDTEVGLIIQSRASKNDSSKS